MSLIPGIRFIYQRLLFLFGIKLSEFSFSGKIDNYPNKYNKKYNRKD